MRGKLNRLIVKFINIDINPFQAAIYHNIHMIKSAYFRCRITTLDNKEECKLNRIYEALLLTNIDKL